MSRGHIIVLVSLLAFLGMLMYQPYPNDDAFLDKQIRIAFLVLYSGIGIGSIFIAIDKGYSWFEGLLCGLFGPLGLLILTLSGDRRKKTPDSGGDGVIE